MVSHDRDLIDREDELATVGEALDRLAAGASELLTITGALGIGKTRLAAELCSAAEARGYLVLSARESGLEGDSALRQTIDALDRDGADGRPAVVVVDDGQWLDERSDELIGALVDRFSNEPLLLALVCRSGQWPVAVEDWMRERRFTAIHLPPLSEEATTALAGDREDQAVWRESGGNPLFALALADAAGSPGELPPLVASVVAADLASLSAEEEAILRAAATVGDRCDLDLAASVAAVDTRVAMRAVEQLSQRELIDVEARARLVFRAPALRRAVYAGVGIASRRATHERIARLLAERGAPAGERARHVVQAGGREPGDVGVLLVAAESAAERQPRDAADWFVAALERMRAADERRAQALVGAAGAFLAEGRGREARDAFEKFRVASPAMPPDPRRALVLARVEHILGVEGPTRVYVRECLEREVDTRSTAALRIVLARDHWRSGEHEEMADEARRALEQARSAGDDHLLASALAWAGMADFARGETANAARRLEEAQGLVDAMPDEPPVSGLEALFVVALLNLDLERYVQAADRFERGTRLAEATSAAFLRTPFRAGATAVELATGQLARARANASETRDLALELGGAEVLMWSHVLVARVALAQGDSAAALDAARGAVRAADGAPSGTLTPAARCAMGIVRMRSGELRLGYEQVLREAGEPDLDRLDAGSRPQTYATLAEAAQRMGEMDRAEEWVTRAESSAERLKLDGRVAIASLARARLLAERDPRASARLAVRAAATLERLGRRADLGRALIVAGRAMSSSGEQAEAVSTLERAHSILSECGAERASDLVARELRMHGQPTTRLRRRGETDGGLAALSRREREVAELVARGLTNQGIADELYVSRKTVEDYLARAFVKLGVSSRAGVAAAIESARNRPR